MKLAIILNIETSTQVCSAALSVNGVVKEIIESDIKNAHAESITLFSKEVIEKSGYTFDQLDAVAVSKGPGSYTGLRIGVSTAKGFCYSLDKPLISIGTLKALAFGMIRKLKEKSTNLLFCPMIDARRMEVYASVFNSNLNVIQETSAIIIDQKSFADILAKQKVVFAGDGAEKCKSAFASNKNAIFLNDFKASADNLAQLAEEKFQNNVFEDVAYFEPFYLKNFIAGIPRVKGLY